MQIMRGVAAYVPFAMFYTHAHTVSRKTARASFITNPSCIKYVLPMLYAQKGASWRELGYILSARKQPAC
eukprot:363490-Chlamydomonas_euryale.AAC.11